MAINQETPPFATHSPQNLRQAIVRYLRDEVPEFQRLWELRQKVMVRNPLLRTLY